MAKDIFGDEIKTNGSQDFANLLAKSEGSLGRTLSVGDKISGEILSIGKDESFVSTGTIHDGVLLTQDLREKNNQLPYKVGDIIDVYVTQVRGTDIRLSTRPTAKNLAEDLEDAFDMMMPVEGKVIETCNGGFRVSVLGKVAFCPISQMDSKRIEDQQFYINKKYEFLITKFEKGAKNIVVSRRRLLEEQKAEAEGAFLNSHKVGDEVTGVITRLEKFGAFLDIGENIEGLIHISEMGWSRIENPGDVVHVGDQVQAKILKIEETDSTIKVSLSMKQTQQEPWAQLSTNIKVGQVVEGKVSRCMKFGAFVQIEPGIEGLIPLSELSSTKRVNHADEILKPNQIIKVLIKDVRPEEHRISLSLKDAEGRGQDAEWKDFSASQKSITFGSLGAAFQNATNKINKK